MPPIRPSKAQKPRSLESLLEETTPSRSRNMAAIRSKGNLTTEIKTIGLLKNAGLKGWRRHQKLPGTPDFVWRKEKVALFLDGCFWHGCPRCYRQPKSNLAYWTAKIVRNRTRDRRTSAQLREMGWRVIRIWECRLKTRSPLRKLKELLTTSRKNAQK